MSMMHILYSKMPVRDAVQVDLRTLPFVLVSLCSTRNVGCRLSDGPVTLDGTCGAMWVIQDGGSSGIKCEWFISWLLALQRFFLLSLPRILSQWLTSLTTRRCDGMLGAQHMAQLPVWLALIHSKKQLPLSECFQFLHLWNVWLQNSYVISLLWYL